MTVEQWLKDEKTIKKSKKGYAHFDYRTDMTQQKDYVTNPDMVRKHGFYPFIHYEKKMDKFTGKEIKEKSRDICYAAHIDRCIYQYYTFLLNELYNERVLKDEINDVAVAYRTNLHVNNIHLAKRAFDFIRAHDPCYIMIGDFKHFFDNLDHKYLKKQWCSLLGVTVLPDDHFAVFKNITKYSKWELEDLLQINHLEDNRRGRKELNRMAKVLTTEQFQKYRSHIMKNPNPFGIPQGSPISALLANVYMLDIDRKVKNIVETMDGLYMRYSDDFIVIIPGNIEKTAADVFEKIVDLINSTPGLKLEPEKTQYFSYTNKDTVNSGERFHENADCKNRLIHYLGFSFDGKTVSVRAKAVTKYYYRMHRKARTIVRNNGISPNGKHISCVNLYNNYSERGKWSFPSYVHRAEKVFGEGESLDRDIRRHMQKIRMELNKNRR